MNNVNVERELWYRENPHSLTTLYEESDPICQPPAIISKVFTAKIVTYMYTHMRSSRIVRNTCSMMETLRTIFSRAYYSIN